MKKNYWWLMVVIVFVVGLMISNLLVYAQENITEIQWEYKTINTKSKLTIEKQIKQDLPILNGLGKDGWGLCGVHGTIYYFKREIIK